MFRKLILVLALCFTILDPVSGTAAVYHVSEAGNDTYCTGLSGADWSGVATPGLSCAWRTVAKVNSSVSGTGDDVYFRSDDIWTSSSSTDYLTVDWSGTVSDPVVIGAYYMSGGTPIYAVSGAKPVLDGDFLAPATEYAGLIHMSGRSYVTVQDLEIRDSNAIGFYATYSNDHITVQRLTVYHTKGSGIVFSSYSPSVNTSFLIDSNEVSYCAHKGATGSVPWGTGILAANSGVSNGVISNNLVHHMYGEGIDVLKCHDVTASGNTVYATKSVGMYFGQGAWNITINDNLVYGTTETAFWNTAYGSPLISILDEAYESPAHANENFKVYNNVVAGGYRGFYLGAGGVTGSYFRNNVLYNNTAIDNVENWRLGGASETPYEATSYIRNNLSWCITPASCTHYTGLSSVTNVVWDHNLWYPAVTGEPSGTGDVASEPTLAKTSGYKSLTGGSLSWDDIKLVAGSAGIDAGVALGAPYNVDAFGVSRPQPAGGAWDMGAHELWAPPVSDAPGSITFGPGGSGSISFGSGGSGSISW